MAGSVFKWLLVNILNIQEAAALGSWFNEVRLGVMGISALAKGLLVRRSDIT